MNKTITIVGAVLVVGIFLFNMCTFQVRSTEVAVLKTWGKFSKDDIKKEAGLYGRWPWPFQSVVITDDRVRVLLDAYEETQTADSQNILVTTYVCWKVDEANPYLFHIASSSVEDAESKLRQLVQTEKKQVVAQYKLANFVSTNDDEFKFTDIEQQLEDRIAKVAREEYGIKIIELGIRRLSFPQAVTEQVFERMKKSEEAKVAKYKTEGEAEARDIRARASAISANIMAVADRLAENIKAQANKEVGEYYREFEKNVELRLFLDQLKASKEILKERTTLVLDSVVAPLGLIDLDYAFGDLIKEISAKRQIGQGPLEEEMLLGKAAVE